MATWGLQGGPWWALYGFWFHTVPTLGPPGAARGQAMAKAHLDFCSQPPGEPRAARPHPTPTASSRVLVLEHESLLITPRPDLPPSEGLPVSSHPWKPLTQRALESWPLLVFPASLLSALRRENGTSSWAVLREATTAKPRSHHHAAGPCGPSQASRRPQEVVTLRTGNSGSSWAQWAGVADGQMIVLSPPPWRPWRGDSPPSHGRSCGLGSWSTVGWGPH